MIDAEVLATPPFLDGGGDNQLSVYSIWFPRGGDYVRMAAEVAAVSSTKLTIQVYHKNRTDPGDGVAYGAGTNIVFDNATGRTMQEWAGLKEMVRFLLTVEASTGDDIEPPADGTVGWVIFRFLKPVWFEAVKV